MLTPDPEANEFLSKVFDILASDFEEEMSSMEVSVYLDFTRHNGLYEYGTWSLPIWAQIVTKKKMSPSKAMAALNYSMLPYYSVYKSQD